MEITDVKIFLRGEQKLKGYATITFDNCFVVRNIKIISGNNGFFVAMPNMRRKDGTYKDIAHPINNEMRKKIEEKIIEAYNKELERQKASPREISRNNSTKLRKEIDKTIEQKFSQ
jgi:stage V sporulation protein G